MDEQEIIVAVRAGQREQYAELVRVYQDRVFRLCMSYLKNRTEAEETAQDAFIDAYKSLKNFRGDSKFSTWLYKITLHRIQDLIRKKAREKTQSWEELLENNGDRIERLFQMGSVGPSNEDKDLVDQILACLKPETAQILKMREIHGFTYDEISKILDLSLDSVKGRLKRARQEVQKKMRHLIRRENDLISGGQT